MPEYFLHGVEVIEMDGGARPIKMVASSVIGLVGTAPRGPVNKPTLILGSRAEAIEIFGEGTPGYTIPAALSAIFDQTGAMVVVVNVADPDNVDHQNDDYQLDVSRVTLSDVIGGVNPDGSYRGAKCLLAAQTECKVQPRILIAPGFTHEQPNGNPNPLIGELISIADRLRATVIADCPNDARDAVVDFVENHNSSRLYCIYPWAKIFKNNEIIEEPLSARIAGVIANSDNARGFWWSPSNCEIKGIVGLTKPIDFAMGDPNCLANFLNDKRGATVIQQDGFRVWGNRTTSADTKWQFLSVRRTADLINDSLMRAHMWAVDRNITRTYVEDVAEGVNNYLRYLKNIGAIIGGECWSDSALNTPELISQGKITFDFDFTPPYPAEHITFRSRMVNNYLTEIFE